MSLRQPPLHEVAYTESISRCRQPNFPNAIPLALRLCGLSFKVELQYNPAVELSVLDYVQLFTFADYGRVWFNDHQFRADPQYLASVGGGMRLGLAEHVSATVELGKPMLRDAAANGNRDLRGFFTLNLRY